MSYECPLCEYGRDENKSLAAVRAHINASGREGHDWDTLKSRVRGEESTGANVTDESPDPDPEPDSANESAESETQTDIDADPEMIDKDAEYAEQMKRAVGTDEEGSSPDANPGGDGGSNLFPPVSTTTIVVLVGVVVLAFVAYRMMQGDGDSEDDVNVMEDESNDGKDTMLSMEDIEG